MPDDLGPEHWRLLCGSKQHARSHRQRDISIDQYALVWFEHGGGELRYGERWWQLQPGDCFKRLPGRAHDVRFDAGSVTHYIGMPAPTADLMGFVRMQAWDAPVIRPGRAPAVRDGFRRLADWLARSHGVDRLRCFSAMLAFCADLHQQALRGDPEQAAMEQACRLLEEAPELNVPSVAKACGFPYSTFRQRFQEAFGCSAMAWRIRRRVERAQAMLAETELGIAAIAEELGYGDRFRFTRQFRQLTGQSPSEWRRRTVF